MSKTNFHSSQHHVVKLCLAPELRSALVKYMAKHDLDKEYATLLLVVKQLYSEQLISREVYEVFLYRYSRKLSRSEDLEAKMSLEMRAEKQKVLEKERQFSMVLDQWNIHGVDWRQKWIAEAELWKDRVKQAQLVLDLAGT